MKKKMYLSKGIKKYIRKEKSRIRKEVLHPEDQKKEIELLLAQFDQADES
jgi:hypothetical protein